MIEHQIEWLMSEAWGVSGDEHAQDFAHRVDAYLEAQQFETGLGSLEELPDIVQEVYGRARTPKVSWKYATDYAVNDLVAGNKEEDRAFGQLPSPLVNRFIRIGEAIPIVNTKEETVEWHGYFIDEYILAPPHILAIINSINGIERDNGEQSE